jgi:16S rRNA (guanine527-N7)-methyltransferase
MTAIADSLSQLLALQDIVLREEQVAQLVQLTEELLRWNRSRNLTAIATPADILEKHLIDSLTLLPYARSSRRMLDMGSGAGFPALPVKICCPSLEVFSVDAAAKKISFQKHAARLLKLEGFTAQHGRMETLGKTPAFAGRFDLVTARAVGSLPLLTRLAGPCLTDEGQLIAMKGPEGMNEREDNRAQLLAEGWTVRCEMLRLPVSGARRSLLICKRGMVENHNI